MGRATVRWTALIVMFIAAGAVARASETADGLPQLDERTAYLVGARTLKLGLLAFDYGLSDRLDIGSDPPFWAARAAVDVLVPNLHIKQIIFERPPVTVSVRVAGYYADLKTSEAVSGSLIAAPLSLFASFRLQDRVWLHTEGAYVYARAFGAGDLNQANFGGAVASQTVQLGGMLEFRLTRTFSLTATGRYQVYTADLAFDGSGNVDPFTTVDVNGRAVASVSHPWEAIGGIALLWKHVHLILGAGYGYYFLPGIDLAYPKRTFVPDASLSVVL
ncbi:MAG TPA: hypothetical protein VH853_19750 [Polyangia bacterium]|nr:hypothetical protein [Polyangia bacterium]